MIFNTFWFWFFLIGTWILLRTVPAQFRLWAALGACVIFHYHYAGPAGMKPVIALGVFVYFLARNAKSSRRALLFGITVCTLALGYFKYRAFFGSLLGLPDEMTALGPIPLGISFFVFEFVHYLVTVLQGGAVIRSPLSFSLFTIFFPSLVAGPIKRAPQFMGEVKKKVAFRPDSESLVVGGTRLLIGMAKKSILADPIATYSENLHAAILQNPQTAHASSSWLLLVALALRIYFDFSGYSDMAIGAARTMNIQLPENFNWPYVSKNLQEFWRRWHISLSTWIRDYIYIPLGGGRVSATRVFGNFVATFAICGLWHGASGHFVVWGLWHGVGLAAERAAMKVSAGKIFFESVGGWCVTFLFVALGWLIFFYPIHEAVLIARSLIPWGGT